jgi:septum formation protein
MTKPSNFNINLILASASRGRKHLLEQLKIPFEVLATDIDEDSIIGKSSLETIKLRAVKKAEKASELLLLSSIHKSSIINHQSFILTADTEVVFHDKLIGKPKDYSDAVRIFKLLSGETHEVVTAISISKIKYQRSKTHLKDQKLIIQSWNEYDKSLVTFRSLSLADIERYLSLTEYTRYTGGYALAASPQDFITRIEGSVSNVIGLPLEKLIPIVQTNHLLPP